MSQPAANVFLFGQVLMTVAVSYFLAHIFDDTIRVVMHLNQFSSKCNTGSVHISLCWQACVEVCKFWHLSKSLSKGVHCLFAF